MLKKNVETFIGCESEYNCANTVIFGAPFDSTTSYRPGTRFGSKAIRAESFGIETYSPYQDLDLTEKNIFDAGDIELPFGNTEKVIDTIRKFTRKIIDDEKLPIMLGGEHLVTLGAVLEIYKKHNDLCIIHFDAHTDLRDEYLGERLSHSSVMRRVWDVIGDGGIYQFGIRSGEKYEFEFAKKHTVINKYNVDGLDKVVESLKGRPVYFSLDLDVLDPSIFPGTGTPEAGGISFNDLLYSVIEIGKLNIVGCDICELSPVYDQSGVSTAVACKILREILLSFTK